MTNMAHFTKADIDGIFQAFSHDDYVDELKKEAKEIMKVAEDSEHFRTVVNMFLQKAMESITAGGLKPKVLGNMVLVSFLVGMKYQQSVGGVSSDPDIDPELLRKMLEGYEDPDNDAEK
jgi:hypothetical protein